MEFLLILVIALFVVIYRMNTGAITYKFIVDKVGDVYEKFAPYSFKKIREKVKELGMDGFVETDHGVLSNIDTAAAV